VIEFSVCGDVFPFLVFFTGTEDIQSLRLPYVKRYGLVPRSLKRWTSSVLPTAAIVRTLNVTKLPRACVSSF